MPSLPLPADVPPELYWYVLWIAVNGVFIFLFGLLQNRLSNVYETAKKKAESNLPTFCEYLYRLFVDAPHEHYLNPLVTTDDLSKFMVRARDVHKPIIWYDRLRRQTSFGLLAGIGSIIVALGSGCLYYFKYPSIEIATNISIWSVVIFTLWSLWHIVNSLVYYFLIERISNEED